MSLARHYTDLKPYLFAVAYNMTGEVQEAEDVVQDAFEDVLRRQGDDIRNAKSYLTRIVINKAIDRLTRLKKERETYPSLWLPEPCFTRDDARDPDILPYAFLYLMEALNPTERAVVILREAFDYSYEDIAAVCDTSVDNSRQILHRARQKLKDVPREMSGRQDPESGKVLQEFLRACLTNDTAALRELLRADVIVYSDGGGKVVAARRILAGLSDVVSFLSGVVRKGIKHWTAARQVTVNGQPALLTRDDNGVYTVLVPEISGGKVLKIFIMRNPDKIFPEKAVTN